LGRCEDEDVALLSPRALVIDLLVLRRRQARSEDVEILALGRPLGIVNTG
jgi:hypothetical protein